MIFYSVIMENKFLKFEIKENEFFIYLDNKSNKVKVKIIKKIILLLFV